MITKWYISTLILVLTVLGIYHNKISSPNQEILVQFNTEEVTIEQSQTAIASIKQQLHGFGIDDIQVYEGENGILKITYYSSFDVEQIQKSLSEEANLTLDCTSVQKNNSNKSSSEKKSKSYNFDVYEIHKSTDGSGSAGKAVLIVKQDFDRFLNPNVVLPLNDICCTISARLFKEAYKVNQKIAIQIDFTSHTIPEVRAGPLKIG